MRRLYPDPGDEDLDDLYTSLSWPEAPDDRPYLYLDMVASVDGAATAGGRTGPLGGEADRLAFPRLREWCDAILVGASTVRVEGYGPARLTEPGRARRLARGLAAVPRVVVVTASAALDPAARLFSDPSHRPVVLTTAEADCGHLEDHAEVVRVGSGRVDLPAAVRRLRDDGCGRLLCEGGPHLNAQLFAAGLVDEVFLTVAPQVVGTSALRIVEGEVGGVRPVALAEVREHVGELLLRYRLGR